MAYFLTRNNVIYYQDFESQARKKPGKTTPNSHALKTLPITPFRSRLWRETFAKVLIPIDRLGEGVPGSQPESHLASLARD